MRSAIFVSGLIGLAAAMPYDNAGELGSPAMEASPALTKRDNIPAVCQWLMFLICSRLPDAYGPTISPDTAAAFSSSGALAKIATSAATPSNYVSSFTNDDGATSTSNYLGYSELQNYDPSACSARCDATGGCIAFNIFFERDPSTNTNPYCCPNPASVTRIKCSLWGTYTSSGTANNNGQDRDSFKVVIAGSNGYNKSPTPAKITSSSVSSPKTAATSVASSTTATVKTVPSSVPSSLLALASSVLSAGPSSNSPANVATSKASSSALSSAQNVASSVASSGPAIISSAASSTSRALSFSSPSVAPSTASSASRATGFSSPSAGLPVASSASRALSLSSPSAGLPVASSGPSGNSTVANQNPALAATTSAPTSAGNTASLAPQSVSNSATVASAKAALTTTDPGSPVTASIPASSAVATACSTPVAAPQLTFNLNHTTTDNYQTLWLYGSIPELGSWAPDNATQLSVYKNDPTNTNWFVAMNLTQGTYFEYKYFQRNDDWSITWPAMANRMYTVPSSCQAQVVLDDAWN